MNETNLPCADCGTELVDRTVETQNLPTSKSYEGEVRVAECPPCDARYYPEQALSQLSDNSNPAGIPQGGSAE